MLKKKKITGFDMKNGILLKNMTGVNSGMNPTRINMINITNGINAV